ncbi:MAG TPA: glycosyltransferase family 1 protein [Bryobacteraceae bacterium]|nr:glycosyltransferase family 1 protein [Bryobacteraceae bacterium]
MRIGVNALYMIPGGVGGTEIYLRNLLAALRKLDRDNEYFVFTNRETGADLPCAVQLPVTARNRPARLVAEQTLLAREARRLRLDVLLNAGFTAPWFSPCPNVTVFHDLQHKRHPEHFRWIDLPFWRISLYAAARRSRLLIAVSEETKRDLMRYYRLPPERIRVIPHGVEDAFFEVGRTRGIPEPFILCVSTLHPHKNHERLLRGFARFRTAHSGYNLVLAGLRGFHAGAVEHLIAELGLADAVRITGWIPRDELIRLYARAAAFVYPSTFEGFGMPVLEAMAAGLPVACSDIEPLRSLTSETTILFPPENEHAISAALERLIFDRSLVEPARVRARQFSWEECARQTLAALTEGSLRAGSSRRSSRPGT